MISFKTEKVLIVQTHIYIYGTDNPEEILKDTFGKAMKRYMESEKADVNYLHQVTGLSISAIYNYLDGKRKTSSDLLCAFCIALKLNPCRQRHLFELTRIIMPDTGLTSTKRERIIRFFLDSCFYSEVYTLENCNILLKRVNEKPLKAPFRN